MLCLDTYALVEINNENPRYRDVVDEDFIVTDIVLAEFYGVMYRKYNRKTADWWVGKLRDVTVSVPRKTMFSAMKFKADSKEKYSFFDCIGYVYARENGFEFVTGDKEFAGREGVRFVENS